MSWGAVCSVLGIAGLRAGADESKQSAGQHRAGGEGCGNSRGIGFYPRPPGMSTTSSISAPRRSVRRSTYPGRFLARNYKDHSCLAQRKSNNPRRTFTLVVAAISLTLLAAGIASAASVKPVPANVALAFKKAAVAARHGQQVQCLHGVDSTRGYAIATYGCTFYRKNTHGKTTLKVGKRKVRVTVSRTVTAELLAPHSLNAEMARCNYTVTDTTSPVQGSWDICEAGWQTDIPHLTKP